MKTQRLLISGGCLLILASAIPASGQQWRNRLKTAEIRLVAAQQEENVRANTPSTGPAIPQSLTPLPADRIVTESLPPGSATFSTGDEFTMPANPMLGPIDPYTGMCYTAACAPSPRFQVFFEGLYLQPGGAEVVYAVEQDGCDPLTAVPTGPVGQLTPDADYGFRTGFEFYRGPQASLAFAYSWFESREFGSINSTSGTTNVLASQVTHPTVAACGDDSFSASADQTVRFQFIDAEYHALLCGKPNCEITLVGGIRYGRLDQNFHARQLLGTATGLANVHTDIRFQGIGLRTGLQGERVNPQNGFLVYGRGFANFLGGEMEADYLQTNQFGSSIAANRDDHRIVTVLEAEIGAGWTSRNQRWRLLAGYQANFWFNALTTSDWINAVRSGAIDSLDSTLTFDGLVARVEYRR